MTAKNDINFIRRWIAFFMVALIISGLTAVPLEWGTDWLASILERVGDPWTTWSNKAALAVSDVGKDYPFLFYGTDWLAFAHVVIALAFLGPYRDPVRNKWVIEWGVWSCVLVLPLALLWAPVRGIPFFWSCIDASFGVLGSIPLCLVLQRIKRMEKAENVRSA